MHAVATVPVQYVSQELLSEFVAFSLRLSEGSNGAVIGMFIAACLDAPLAHMSWSLNVLLVPLPALLHWLGAADVHAL